MIRAPEPLRQLLEEVRSEFVPDPRVSIFEVEARIEGDALVLRGETSEAAAAEALHHRAALLDAWTDVRDEVVRLPLPGTERESHAVVTSAIAPMLAGPLVSEAPVSQVVLGHRLIILRQAGRWYQCRSEDRYLGWVHRGYVVRVDEVRARAWEMGTEGEACISLGGELRADDGEVLARLPRGARVLRQADGTFRLPDGRLGQLVGEVIPLAERALRFPRTGEAMVRSASEWLGAPYLWGGVTPAGVDCSGLAQVLCRLHGVELPRDSDQQAKTGEPVDPGPDFKDLLPGDLLFFAETPRRISHVAISTGGSGIIHSSLGNGGVRRNDMAGALGYERELRDLFVCARRVL